MIYRNKSKNFYSKIHQKCLIKLYKGEYLFMEQFTKIKFKDKDFEMDINLSTVDNSIWLNQKELALFYNTTKNNITHHISNIVKSEATIDSTGEYHSLVQLENGKTVRRKIKFYNLDMIVAIGIKIGSNRGLLLKEFLKDIQKDECKQNFERIIIYNNGKIDIPINIDLKNENAWASVRQIATLFDTSLDNVYLHIKNIFNEGELDSLDDISVSEDSSVTDLFLPKNAPYQKEIYQLSDDGKYYLTKVYNLDVILAVGYRVKSLIAMRFRRWITFVLKRILTRGYYLDEEKCEKCNKVLELENKVLELKNEQLKEIRYYPGDQLRGFIEIKRFLETAEREIVIIDNYFGHEFDDILSKLDVKKTIITNPKNTKVDTCANYIVIKNDYYHDRYIFVDNLCYTFGQSIKDIGIHESTARRLLGFSVTEVHQNIKKWEEEK